MAQLLAPYHNGMRLGQGFNSYTQQICLDRAVLIDNEENRRTVLPKYFAEKTDVLPVDGTLSGTGTDSNDATVKQIERLLGKSKAPETSGSQSKGTGTEETGELFATLQHV
jgi:hypothetical protein